MQYFDFACLWIKIWMHRDQVWNGADTAAAKRSGADEVFLGRAPLRTRRKGH